MRQKYHILIACKGSEYCSILIAYFYSMEKGSEYFSILIASSLTNYLNSVFRHSSAVLRPYWKSLKTAQNDRNLDERLEGKGGVIKSTFFFFVPSVGILVLLGVWWKAVLRWRERLRMPSCCILFMLDLILSSLYFSY